jgi:hypothetical protein
LVWGDFDGNVSGDEVPRNPKPYTPLGSPTKEETNSAQLPSPKVHLKVDSHVHYTIVEQLVVLELAPTSSQIPPKTKSTSSSWAKKPNSTNQRPNVIDKKVSFANSKLFLIFGFLQGCGNSKILVLIVGGCE